VSARALLVVFGAWENQRAANDEGCSTNDQDRLAAAHVWRLEAWGERRHPFYHSSPNVPLFSSPRRNVLRTFVTLSRIQTSLKKAQCDDIQPVLAGGVETNT